ncbi:MAG: SRPBCC family protein [Candidatus Nanopelagicales bacterium]
MSRHDLAREVIIDAPAEVVFAAVTDWPAQGRWVLGTRVAADGPAEGVGGRFTAFTGLGPVGFGDPMEITEWDPPRLVAIRHTGRVVRGSGSFHVHPLPDGRSRMVWREQLDVPLGAVGRAAFVLARPVLAAMLGRSLSALAHLVESGQLGS